MYPYVFPVGLSRLRVKITSFSSPRIYKSDLPNETESIFQSPLWIAYYWLENGEFCERPRFKFDLNFQDFRTYPDQLGWLKLVKKGLDIQIRGQREMCTMYLSTADQMLHTGIFQILVTFVQQLRWLKDCCNQCVIIRCESKYTKPSTHPEVKEVQ